MHWHRPGVDLARGTGNAVSACRRYYVQDIPHHNTADVSRVTCEKCVAIMPDHLAAMRAEIRAARECAA